MGAFVRVDGGSEIYVEFVTRDHGEGRTKVSEPSYQCDLDRRIFSSSKIKSHLHFIVAATPERIHYRCLYNTHLVSGDLDRHCMSNGTMNGTEPVCAHDFLKDRLSLGLIVITFSLIVPVIFLCLDFFFWRRKRARVRKFRFVPLTEQRKIQRFLGHPVRSARMLYGPIASATNTPSSTPKLVRKRRRSPRLSDIEEHFQRPSDRARYYSLAYYQSPNNTPTMSFSVPPQRVTIGSPQTNMSRRPDRRRINQFTRLGDALWEFAKTASD